MKTLIKELLREALIESKLKTNLKGKNILYHTTNIDSAINILNQNTILGSTKQEINTSKFDDFFNGISFSRNSEFKWNDIQFILDGDLIKRNFGKKLLPLDFIKGVYKKFSLKRNLSTQNSSYGKFRKDSNGNYFDLAKDEFENDITHSSNYISAPLPPQSEEFLIGELDQLRNYLLGIRIMDKNIINVNEPQTFMINNPYYNKLYNAIGDIPKYDFGWNIINLDIINNTINR